MSRLPHIYEIGGTFFFFLYKRRLNTVASRRYACFVIENQEAFWENANGRTWAE